MGKGICLALAVLTTAFCCAGQTDRVRVVDRLTGPIMSADTFLYLDRSDSYLRAPLSVFATPLAGSDNFNLSFRVGCELPFSRSNSVQFVAMIPYAGEWDGYGFRIGARHYFRPFLKYHPSQARLGGRWVPLRLRSNQPYIGLDFTYREAFYYTDDSLRYGQRPIRYNVEKTVYTLAVVYGTQFSYKSGIFFQWFVGWGIRAKEAQNNLTAAQKDDLYHWHEGMVTRIADANANFAQLAPVFPAGIRVGYRFR